MEINQLKESLKKFDSKIAYNEDLKKKNWFNIGGKAKIFFKANELKDLAEFLKVLDNKDKEHGVTVHLVDEGLDSGPIIGFMKLDVSEGENESELESRIHKLEHFIYPKILSQLQEGRVLIDDSKIKIDEIFYENGKEYFN